MSDFVRSAASRRSVWVAAGVAVAALLAGCTSNPVQPDPASSTGASAQSGSTSAAPSAVATPSATPTPEATPVTKSCNEVLSPEKLYEFNPNFGANPGYSPKSGSTAADIVALKGISCSWLNQTSGDTIEVAVAHLAPTATESRKNALVTSSKMVPTFSPAADEGYFTVTDSVGRADVFVGDYWIMADSTTFTEPGDAQPIIDAVTGAF